MLEEKVQKLLAMDEGSPEAIVALEELLDAYEALKEEMSKVEADPKKNVALALAVVRFAEWHNSEYNSSAETRSVVGQALWDEVSTHVADILGYAPEDVGPAAGQLDLFALSA